MNTVLAGRRDRLALAAFLAAAFDAVHPFADQWCQSDRDARGKDSYGTHRVYLRTGEPVPPLTGPLPAWHTVTASTYGRLCAVRHVAAYSAAQTAATLLLARLTGVQVKPSAFATGLAINAATHAYIDRRRPLLRLAAILRKSGYIDHCHALRLDDNGTVVAEHGGPGSAQYELDQALHRLIGAFAATATAWCTTRADD